MTIDKIIGSKFNSISRCIDMLLFNLGEEKVALDEDGECVVPEFGFHVQTQWRFVKENKILLASRDIYIPYNQEINELEWDFDEAGRVDDESSIFDVCSKSFATYFDEATVASVEITPIGDLKIIFTNGVLFETFTPSMRKDEFWRFIGIDENKNYNHTIVFDV